MKPALHPIDQTNKELALALIAEELKSRKLFRILKKIGLEECCYQPTLDTLILRALNLDDGTDETFKRFTEVMERRSRKIGRNLGRLEKEAGLAFADLCSNTRRMNPGC